MGRSKAEKNSKDKPSFEEEDGGVYLLVADESSEFEAALRRAAYLANLNNGHVAILYVIEDENYMHWRFVERRIQSDKREEAEKMLWEIAQRLYDMSGLMPAFYIREGKTRQQVAEIVSTDKTLRVLVLGAASSSTNPLISYFTGKGLPYLRVPLLIVPDSL
jgi:hypothetical protein